MANIPIYTEEELKDRKVDWDMSMVYNMPFIERTIFQYTLRDVCLKEIINFENKREHALVASNIHPKNSLKEARELLGCFAKNIKMEPICNEPFNEARECLFRSRMKLRWCKSQLDLFEECYHDPIQYAKFEEAATRTQLQPKDYITGVWRTDFPH
jgi:hypothetical protein